LTKEQKMIKELENYDSGTVSNAVATYPADKENCLGLYEPSETYWYTDQDIRCIYPELGPRCGYVVTVVYGKPDPKYGRLGFGDLLKAIVATPKPVILILKQNFGKALGRKNALLGGNMMTAFRQTGVAGVLCDGPVRDYREMKELGIQCLSTGLAPGHGVMEIQAINVPVRICSMDVCPGEMVHMDENGAVKFPVHMLEQVLDRSRKTIEDETIKQSRMKQETSPEKLAAAMKGIYK
jgi:regulator of RNase E activity RraA